MTSRDRPQHPGNTELAIVCCGSQRESQAYDHLRGAAGVPDTEVLFCSPHVTGCSGLRYNEALQSTQARFVAFVDRETRIETPNWGQVLLAQFRSSGFAVLGVLGSLSCPMDGRWKSQRNDIVGTQHIENEGGLVQRRFSGEIGLTVIRTVCLGGPLLVIDRDQSSLPFDELIRDVALLETAYTLSNHLAGLRVGVTNAVKAVQCAVKSGHSANEVDQRQFAQKFAKRIPVRVTPTVIADCLPVQLKDEPKLSIVIPTKSNLDLLFRCLTSIKERSTYRNFEIIIGDTGSTPAEKDAIRHHLSKWSTIAVRLVEYDYYHYSRINNDLVMNHVSPDSELILFCNNDIEVNNHGHRPWLLLAP